MDHHILKRIDRHTALQFFKFLIVGCINTGLSLAVIYILQNGFDVKYTKANLIGYILGVINSFFWNKLWVFQKKDGKFVREALLFLLIFGICYSLQYICLIVFVEELYLSENWSQLFSMGIYTIANYILNRCITFKMPSQI